MSDLLAATETSSKLKESPKSTAANNSPGRSFLLRRLALSMGSENSATHQQAPKEQIEPFILSH